MYPKREIKPGTRYGRLRVLGEAERKGYMTCCCDCGKIKDIRKTSLTANCSRTLSCGCIQREKARKRGKKEFLKRIEQYVEVNRQFDTNFHVIENQQPPKNNTSGVKGVSWCKEREKWEVYLNVHGKRIRLGRYQNLEDAIRARKSAEEQYYRPLIEAKNAMQLRSNGKKLP